MPVQYQVLFANFIGLFWNVVLSYIANKPSTGQDKVVWNQNWKKNNLESSIKQI